MAYFDTAGLKYSGFRATSTISTSTIWALPNADGTSGQVLTTDGNGNLKLSIATYFFLVSALGSVFWSF
jgi:hypothetical protein